MIWFHLLIFIFTAFVSLREAVASDHSRGSRSHISYKNGKRVYEKVAHPLKIAFCVTGQLARLELLSKIHNIFIPNAAIGHSPHVFIYVDGDVENVRQTYWNYNYSESVFGRYDRRDLKAYVDQTTQKLGYGHLIRTRTRIEPPPRSEFHVINDMVPVRAKAYTGHDGPRDNYESAESRFQNNMRWMAGLRECVRWMMEVEYKQEWFYDVVVRLRDDSYAMGPWLFDAQKYVGALVSSKTGTFQGINDHNFAVDRYWADDFLRGLSEDYYFNASLSNEPWGNPEHRIYMVATAYNIPLRYTSLCEQPLVPLRGLVNSSYWRIHPLYIRHVTNDCDEDTAFANAAMFGYQGVSADSNSKASSSSTDSSVESSSGTTKQRSRSRTSNTPPGATNAGSTRVNKDLSASSHQESDNVDGERRNRPKTSNRKEGGGGGGGGNRERGGTRREGGTAAGREGRRETEEEGEASEDERQGNSRDKRDKKSKSSRVSDNDSEGEADPQQHRHLLSKGNSKNRKRDKEKEARKADLEAHGLATLKCCDPKWLEFMHARVAPVYTMELEKGWQFT